MFDLTTLKNERKLVKKSLDKMYRMIESGENHILLTDVYFQLNKLNEDIKSCKKVKTEDIRKQSSEIVYNLCQLGHVYWNNKRLNKTIQCCIDDITIIKNIALKAYLNDNIYNNL